MFRIFILGPCTSNKSTSVIVLMSCPWPFTEQAPAPALHTKRASLTHRLSLPFSSRRVFSSRANSFTLVKLCLLLVSLFVQRHFLQEVSTIEREVTGRRVMAGITAISCGKHVTQLGKWWQCFWDIELNLLYDFLNVKLLFSKQSP